MPHAVQIISKCNLISEMLFHAGISPCRGTHTNIFPLCSMLEDWLKKNSDVCAGSTSGWNTLRNMHLSREHFEYELSIRIWTSASSSMVGTILWTALSISVAVRIVLFPQLMISNCMEIFNRWRWYFSKFVEYFLLSSFLPTFPYMLINLLWFDRLWLWMTSVYLRAYILMWLHMPRASVIHSYYGKILSHRHKAAKKFSIQFSTEHYQLYRHHQGHLRLNICSKSIAQIIIWSEAVTPSFWIEILPDYCLSSVHFQNKWEKWVDWLECWRFLKAV